MGVDEVPVAGNRRDRPYRRIGDTAKCPACGWSMDPAAYRCPKCHIYFCFKCRVRVTEREPQFQCADQACPCYGKLLCAACTVVVPEFADVTRKIPQRKVKEGENWGCWAFMLPIPVGLALGFVYSIVIGMAGAAAIFIGMAFIMKATGSTWFETERVIPAEKVTENKQVAEHRCCIQCKHPIKVIR